MILVRGDEEYEMKLYRVIYREIIGHMQDSFFTQT